MSTQPNLNYNMKYRTSSDPKYIGSAADAPNLHVYKCTQCAEEATSFTSGAPFCAACQRYMVPHQKTDSSRVQKIMNRTLDYDKPFEVKKEPLEQMWDDGVVRTDIRGEIRPIAGRGVLAVHGNFSKTAWLEKVVNINGGYYRLADIGRVLQEFI